MNYNKINNIDVKVDAHGNIILQDVNAESITINHNDIAEFGKFLSLANEELLKKIKILIDKRDDFYDFNDILDKHFSLLPEVKLEKESIKNKLIELKYHVESIQAVKSLVGEANIISENIFENINFDRLILAIKNGNCVLFIGPEIATDQNGNSIHENFFNNISNEGMIYNHLDGFFMPGSEPNLQDITKQYYSEVFPEQNNIGNGILEMLAQIPFKLIVSYCPDDSLSRIFSRFNVEHTTEAYSGEQIKKDFDFEANLKGPVIFNALGCAAKNGRYVFTHKQFDDYIKKENSKRIPLDIEAKIKESTNYIFIGFSYDKWYYRLLMFGINMGENANRYSCETKDKISQINREFISKQFSINFIHTDYNDFVKVLLKKCRDAGLCKSLKANFAESSLKELETIRIKNLDCDTLEGLNALKQKLINIEKKSLKILENG